MSLLEQINARNNELAAKDQEAQQAQLAEDQKPDAVQQARQKRQDYSQAMANAPAQEPSLEEATPEEQAQFTKLEKQLVEYIYGDSSDNLLKAVSATGDVVEGIGQTTFDLVKMIAQNNPGTDDEILMALGESAVEYTTELVETSDPSVDLNEDQMAEALSIAVTNYMESDPNSVDPDMKEYMATAAPAQL